MQLSPISPDQIDWSVHYPAHFPKLEAGQAHSGDGKQVEMADVGCGFGGLSGKNECNFVASPLTQIAVSLADMFPDKLILAMEIRERVVEIVQERIVKIRAESAPKYSNVACVRVNAMKNLPNWFRKGQVGRSLQLQYLISVFSASATKDFLPFPRPTL